MGQVEIPEPVEAQLSDCWRRRAAGAGAAGAGALYPTYEGFRELVVQVGVFGLFPAGRSMLFVGRAPATGARPTCCL